LTALLPLRPVSLAALIRGGLRAPFGLRRRGCSCRSGPGSRAARTAGLLSRSREQRSSGRRIRPLRGRVRLPLTLPVAPATEVASTRTAVTVLPSRRAAVRSGGPSAGRALARSPVFCNRERFTSTTREPVGPRAAGPRLPSLRTDRAAPPLSRRCRSGYTAQGSRSWPQPRPTPHQAYPVG
jgi:hypothetical protein